MTPPRRPCSRNARRRVLAALALAAALAACGERADTGYQGYVEGEYAYVGAAIAGRLQSLGVKRGDDVAAGAPLFTLESDNEAAMRAQAEAQLKAAEATLADLRAGKRAPEVDVARAELAAARADAQKSAMRLARDEAQYAVGGIARAALDDSRTQHDADVARVRQLESEVAVAVLPSRDEQIRAQASQVAAARAAVDQAAWRERQARVAAAAPSRVEDTLYRPGEYVNAGMPIVKLLPRDNLKLRFFVPQPRLGALAVGQRISAHCDGCAADIAATVSFIASEAEFTPPVIYSNDTRSKLVFMVEARPAADAATRLHPGQPVVVRLP
ncbi:MAG TPA: HlyD family efflux transporter periplasmic adaptor subunit [Casimicrobiaceae bacterium]|nr:HlyD family efflux transporter periplasmic adaptor subunit [Casimicrobiaceae bacterium]